MSVRATRLFALAILLLFPLSIFWWHRADTRPSSMDETRHMKLATDYRDWFWPGVPLTNPWTHAYPPLYHLSIIPALSLGIPSEAKAAATHALYLVLFVTGCILLGRTAQRPDWESLFGALLCLGYFEVLWASRRALIDFPLMAWVTLSVALLSRTRGFASLRASIWWAVFSAAGMLTKAPFVFFLIGPVLWTLGVSTHTHRKRNALLAFAVLVALCVPWYFWQGAYFIGKATSLAGERTGIGTDPRTLAGWWYYIRLIPSQMGWLSLMVTLIGIILCCRRDRAEGHGLLIAWVVSGYVGLSLLVNKDPRHTLPLLPALAHLSARGWGRLTVPWKKPWLYPFIGTLCLFLNIAVSDLPVQEDWKHVPILQLLSQRRDRSQSLLLVSILSHHPRFFARTLKWSAIRAGLDFNPVSPGDSDVSFVEYIILRPGDQGTEGAVLDEQWQNLQPQRRAFTELFSICGRYALPDGSEAIIYERNPHPRFHLERLTISNIERHLAHSLARWIQSPFNVTVHATPDGLRQGRLEEIHISCSPCTVHGVQLQKLDVQVEKPWLNLYRLWDEDRLGLLAFKSLSPGIQIEAGAARHPLAKLKGLTGGALQFLDDKVIVQGKFKNVPLKAEAAILLDNSHYAHLDAILKSISIAHIPLPGMLLGKAHRQSLGLYPNPECPGRISIHAVTVQAGELTIS